jgi:tRNA pseudouridine38-40 synthase
MRYLFHLAYQGTRYHGWQRQKAHPSVQETLESALEQMVGQKASIHGCGRTDTGVHASQYFFHADLPEKFKGSQSVFVLNKNLPGDISIFGSSRVDPDFNAQLDARRRTYSYYFHLVRDPMLAPLSTYLLHDPDDGKILDALGCLQGEHDFRSYTLTPDRQDNMVCRLFSAEYERSANQKQIRFRFTGDRFARAMVRLLVSELLNIGLGKRSIRQFNQSLHQQNPVPFARPAYPQGLYLSGIEYPDLNVPRLAREPF